MRRDYASPLPCVAYMHKGGLDIRKSHYSLGLSKDYPIGTSSEACEESSVASW